METGHRRLVITDKWRKGWRSFWKVVGAIPAETNGDGERKGVPVVLFVCAGNGGRSQMAQVVLKKTCQGKVRVESAGIVPAKSVNDVVRQLMLDLRMEEGLTKPQLIQPEMLERADWIIDLGCDLTKKFDLTPYQHKLMEWPIPELRGKSAEEVRHIYKDIQRRVGLLVNGLRNVES